MKLNTPIRWSVAVLAVIVVIQFLAIILVVYYFPPVTFDLKTVKPTVDFRYKDSLLCHIVFSTHKEGVGISLPWHEVKEFTLAGLDTDQPTLKTSYYSQPVVLRKVFESETHITLEYAEPNWNTETIGIMKNTGTFVQSMTGLQGEDPKFQYAIAQKGRCD